MAEKVEVLNIDFSPTAQSAEQAANEIVGLKSDIDKLKDALETADKGTEDYNKTMDALVSKQKELAKVVDATAGSIQSSGEDMMDIADRMQHTVNLAAGISGAFEAAEGALKLFGIENEAVAESVEKMMGLMAMTQGFQAIADGIQSYKQLNAVLKTSNVLQKIFNVGKKQEAVVTATATTATNAQTAAQWSLNAAMDANPLGVIILAVTALVGGIMALTSWLSNATDKTEDMIRVNDKLDSKLSDMNDELDRSVLLAQAEGKSQKEIIELKIENAIATEKETIAAIDQLDAMKKREDMNETELEQLNKLLEKRKEANRELQKLNNELDAENIRESKRKEEEAKKAAEEARKQAQDNWRKYLEDKKSALDRYNDLLISSLPEEERIIAEQQKLRDDDLKQTEENYKRKLITREQYEKEKLIINKRYNDFFAAQEKSAQDEAEAAAWKWQQSAFSDFEKKEKEKTDILLAASNERIELITRNSEKEIAKLDEATNPYSTTKVKIQANEKFIKEYQQQIQTLEQQLKNVIEEAGNQDITKFDTSYIVEQIEELEKAIKLLTDANKDLGDSLQGETLEQLAIGLDSLINFSSELTSIGDGISSAWGDVFSVVQNGLLNVADSLKKGEKGWKSYSKIAGASLDVATSLLTALADEQDDSTKEGFDKQKKYQTAAAVTSTLAGVVNAWSSSMELPFPMNVITGGILSAMMTTMGAIQVAQISKTKFGDNSVNGAGQTATPSISALQSLGQGVSATTSIEGASTEGEIKDSRVYVVESDITSTQNKVRTVESESTF